MPNGRIIASCVVAGFVLVGCSSAAEKATEELIERGSGGEVDLDRDGGMSFETEDGSFSFDADGNVQMESDDGSFSMDSQSGELADGFPDVPLPDNAQIRNSGTQTADGATHFSALLEVDGDGAEVYEALRSDYEAAGYSNDSENVSQGDGTYTAFAGFENDEHLVVLTVMGQNGESTTVSLTVAPPDS